MSILVYPQNNTEYTAEDARSYLSTRGSGIYSSGDDFNLVTFSSREITIGSGLAWMRLSKFEGICVAVKNSETVSVAAAGTTARTDLIVLRYDQTQTPGVASIVCKTGSTSVQRDSGIYELGLYQISVPANSNQIIASHIKDVRLDASVCGLMTDGVNKLPTQSYFDQIQKQISDFGKNGNNAIATFNSNGNSAISTFNSNGNSAISTFTSNGQSSISSFQQKATTALDDLESSVDNITSGSDVMLQTAFNKAGKTGQVAFEDDLNDVFPAVYISKSSVGSSDVILVNVRSIYFEDTGDDVPFLEYYLKKGKQICFRAYKLKQAGAQATDSEIRLATRFTQGLEPLENVCEPLERTLDLRFVECFKSGRATSFYFETMLNGVRKRLHLTSDDSGVIQRSLIT